MKPFLLSQLQNLNINIVLYRDDGLAISNATLRETDNRKYAEVLSTRRRKKLFRDGRGILNHRKLISHNASSKKIEQFLRRMHWKACFFFNPDTATHSEDTHDFKSSKNPPRID